MESGFSVRDGQNDFLPRVSDTHRRFGSLINRARMTPVFTWSASRNTSNMSFGGISNSRLKDLTKASAPSLAGSDEGGANWAGLASLIETCKFANPQIYFTDLITRLVNGWPQDRIDELMPWHWATQQPP
jgi:hypothetical protein